MNLFLCLTPLHIFLTFLIEERKSSDMIILIDQKGVLGDLDEFIFNQNMFRKYIYINCKKTNLVNICAFAGIELFKSAGIMRIVSVLKNQKYSAVFSYNDVSPEVQFILSKISCSEFVYIEDGSAAYSDLCVKKGKLKKLIIKLCFKFYDTIEILGTSKYIDFGLYSHPSLVRSENRFKPVKKITFSDSSKIKLQCLLSAIKKIEYNFARILIFVPKKTNSNLFIEKVLRFSSSIGVDSAMFYYKKHPLDIRNIYYEGGFCIEENVPGEFLPFIYTSVEIVFGMDSTALKNIKTFFPEIAVYNVSAGGGGRYADYLKSIGVKEINLAQI